MIPEDVRINGILTAWIVGTVNRIMGMLIFRTHIAHLADEVTCEHLLAFLHNLTLSMKNLVGIAVVISNRNGICLPAPRPSHDT